MKNKVVICDFDGTITKQDTINLFLQKYTGDAWLKAEQEWLEGKIGSRECMQAQFELIGRLSRGDIDCFLNSVDIDEYFPEFYKKASEQGLEIVIVSDGFNLFIEKILENHTIEGIKIFTNTMRYQNSRFFMEFPNANPFCKRASGTCKCSVIDYLKTVYENVIYVGDGISDTCVCSKADVLFAKNKLLKYCEEHKIPYTGYNSFYEVMNDDRIGLVI